KTASLPLPKTQKQFLSDIFNKDNLEFISGPNPYSDLLEYRLNLRFLENLCSEINESDDADFLKGQNTCFYLLATRMLSTHEDIRYQLINRKGVKELFLFLIYLLKHSDNPEYPTLSIHVFDLIINTCNNLGCESSLTKLL